MKRAGRLLTGRDVIYRYDVRPKKLLLGTLYGGWTIAPEYLDSTSIMYSFGVGNDISFDLAAIGKFGMQVHGFDPSPQAVAWIANQRLPPQYSFHSYGLGTQDGAVSFFSPNRNTGMYSVNAHHRGVTGTSVTLPVHTLSTIVQSLKTSQIDVLKNGRRRRRIRSSYIHYGLFRPHQAALNRVSPPHRSGAAENHD